MDTSEWVEVSVGLLAAGASDRGGYSRRQVELLGLPWPLPRGWKKSVTGNLIPKRAAEEFLRLSNQHLAGKVKQANAPETISTDIKPGGTLQMYVLGPDRRSFLCRPDA